jgi:hypothetical protein
MKMTYALTRVPHHSELRSALARLPRLARDRVTVRALEDHKIDLNSALANDDPETLTSSQRRAVAQLMHDRGAAFMLSAVPGAA